MRLPYRDNFPAIVSATRTQGFNDGMTRAPPANENDLEENLTRTLAEWDDGTNFTWTMEDLSNKMASGSLCTTMQLPQKNSKISMIFSTQSKCSWSWAIALTICMSAIPTGAANESLAMQGAYAVFEKEVKRTSKLFDGTLSYCISVNQQAPPDYLFARLILLYDQLIPMPECKPNHQPKFDLRIGEVTNDKHLQVTFDCMSYCRYESTYALEMSAGNWIVKSTRTTMQ